MENKAFVDTHAHINMMVKKNFDILLTSQELDDAATIIQEAADTQVETLINVGTSLVESINCIKLAHMYKSVYAVVGIHPNDCTETWRTDFQEIVTFVHNKKQHKIVGIGECGLDMHYPDFNLQRQKDAFHAHIELALKHDLALVVHSRDAYDETLQVIEMYKHDIKRGVMHCFSYDRAFADYVVQHNFLLGIGATVTYPKNNELRAILQAYDLSHIVLETDAPFLPPQALRGKQNHPKYIATIAEYIAQLKQMSVEEVASITTQNARKLFNLGNTA